MGLSAASLTGALVAFLSHAGVAFAPGACAVIGVSIVQMLATWKVQGSRRAYTDPFYATALAAGLVALSAGGARSGLYLGADTGWGVVAMLLATALYGGAALTRRQAGPAYLAAATAFGAYWLGLRYFDLSAVEFYTMPLGLAVLAWSDQVMRERLAPAQARALDLVGTALWVAPSALRAFDLPADPQTLPALGASLAMIFAGMAMKRRDYLLAGSFLFVGIATAKGVHLLAASDAGWWTWGLVLGTTLMATAALIERKLGSSTTRLS
jgi:hypothetical protein